MWPEKSTRLLLTEPHHILDELAPEEDEAPLGVLKMTIAGEADDAGGKVEFNLMAHFPLERIFNILGIGHAQEIGGDLVALEEFVVVAQDIVETMPLTGDVIPTNVRRALQGE